MDVVSVASNIITGTCNLVVRFTYALDTLCYCLQENLSEVDPGSRLGLGPECVESYRVGDQLRTVGSRLHTPATPSR